MTWNKLLAYTIASIFFLSCGSKKERKTTTEKATTVDVMIATPTVISNTLEANGSVIAGESVELRSEISGRLVYLNIPEGKRIAQGTVLARINDADIRAQINKLNAQLVLAEKTAERYRKLYEMGGLNQSEYDVAVNQIAMLKADVSFQKVQLAKTVLKAPFNGTVGLRQVSPGAYVTPQDVLATFQKTDAVKVDFNLPQDYARHLKVGSSVLVAIGSDEEKYRATIIAIEPQIQQATRNLKLRATLQGVAVNPGTFVKVYVQQGEDKQQVMVPANAIIPEAKAKKLVVVKGGKAVMTTVQTGLRRENMVAIESGIQPGDSIVVSGVLFARPNSNVKIRKVVPMEELTQKQ